MITKEQLRGEIGARRRKLASDWIRAASLTVCDNLVSMESFKSAGTLALYRAIAGEVRLDALFTICRELGKQTCIPVFNQAHNLYEMARVTASTRYKTGHYSIEEPVVIEPVALKEIDMMVVPGVAFDPNGNRLGRGGGYYDRLLKGYPGFSVAVAFDFQVFEEIPVESRDIPVNALITETKKLKVSHNY